MNTRIPTVKPMELLAPAGSFAAFEAALAEGADAVYLGAPALNARASSRDFTFAEIEAMIQYAHGREAKVYIAMNSLLKEVEIPIAVESLAHFDAFAADALIIQDLGLLHLARTGFPNLKLHASTLMAVHNSNAVQTLIGLGCGRVVLPRELTLEEIGTIFRKTGAELEVFVHGAMCFSYSGLCLFSSLHGGKSSLRGHCVQPCRRRYAWQKKKGMKGKRQAPGKGGGYLFSMNDLSAIELLPALGRAGVASLKIEGRLKSAEYVRKTVRAYRLMLDNQDKTGSDLRKILAEAGLLLDEAMGRRRSTGFFPGPRPREAVTPHFSGNVGIMVGTADRLETKGNPPDRGTTLLRVSLRHPVQAGERLRLHNEKTGDRTSFTLHSLRVGGRRVQQANAGQTVTIETVQKFSGRPEKSYQGSLFRVDIGTGRQDEKRAREKILDRRLETAAPAREKIHSLMKTIAGDSLLSGHTPVKSGTAAGKGDANGRLQWWVKVSGFRDMHFRLPVRPGRYIVPLTEDNIKEGIRKFNRYARDVVWSLPAIIPEDRLDWYSGAAAALAETGYTRFQVGHFSQLSLFPAAGQGLPPLQIYGDYTVNVLNSIALEKMRRMGFSGTLFSIETDRENLEAAMGGFSRHRHDFLVGLYGYGRPPLFTARLDDRRFEYGKRFVSPRGEEYAINRSDDLTLVRSTGPYSLLGEWKNIGRAGIDYLFLDLSTGNMKRNVSELISLLNKKGEAPPAMTGNYFEALL
ncbi:MAG: U32 family peptidase [Desulfobulbaceae bacterium]|nr:U32 family peptidase [Desulfobulbaceae bacterium]